MIRLLQTSNFRMLRSNSVALKPFHVLVGKNATGKSTFLGALQFISDVLRQDVHFAVEQVAPSFLDLCFDPKQPIALAVEVDVAANGGSERRRLRYEIEVGIDEEVGLRVQREALFLLPEGQSSSPELLQASLFGGFLLLHESTPKGWRRVVNKAREGKDYFRDEKTNWNNVFRFGAHRAALGSLPEDPDRFPLSLAVRRMLRDGVRTLALDAREMRSASPPGGRSDQLELNGSNVPEVVRAFQKRDPVLFEQWVQHVALAVEGLRTVDVWERPEDRHLVLRAGFDGLHEDPVPSWLLSDGTLRLLALTLLGYALPEEEAGIYLIEEPENGLHPLAIQVAYEALSDPGPGAQFLCATHSPLFLAHVDLDEALVFRRSPEGTALVQRGPEVAELQQWSGQLRLPDLFVTGVLA